VTVKIQFSVFRFQNLEISALSVRVIRGSQSSHFFASFPQAGSVEDRFHGN